MGRYLSCAIAISMEIIKKDNKPFDVEELNNTKRALKRIFNFDLYNIKEDKNLIRLELKKDIFDSNIHDLCIELKNSLYQSNFLLYENDYLNKPKENWPITLIKTQDDKKYMVKLTENSSSSNTVCRDLYWFGFSPLLRRDIKNWRDYIFNIEGIHLFLNINKISSEDETELICLLNWFKKDYFKNKLSDSIIFYITD